MKQKMVLFLSNRPYYTNLGNKYRWMQPKKSGLYFFEICGRIDRKR